MKLFIKIALLFIFICLCGLFVGAAGGIRWGTVNAGALAAITFLVGLCASWVVMN